MTLEDIVAFLTDAGSVRRPLTTHYQSGMNPRGDHDHLKQQSAY